MSSEEDGPWIDMESGIDDRGRARFTLYWVADYQPGHPDGEQRRVIRGQCFYADPTPYKTFAEWKGKKPQARVVLANIRKGGT